MQGDFRRAVVAYIHHHGSGATGRVALHPLILPGSFPERPGTVRVVHQAHPARQADLSPMRVAAEKKIESGMRRQRRREVIDKMAATLILQAYLDRPGLSER